MPCRAPSASSSSDDDALAADHDLVVLDVSLPSEDGRDVLARIRASSDVPVIMLTGLGAETDRIVGLKLGADDYVTKPFSPGELVAR
ncbi:MAG TPA: response regulator, partial [Acidimicrobiales bacterium]